MSDLMKSLDKNEDKKGLDSLLNRAETLNQQKVPEKHEHDAGVTEKMKNFQHRDSLNPKS